MKLLLIFLLGVLLQPFVLFAAAPTIDNKMNMVLLQKLIASDGAAIDFFGNSVAIDGDILVVGAYLDDDAAENSGSVYIYQYSPHNTNFEYVAKLTALYPAANDFFGVSVAINGDTVVVGAHGDDDVANGSGSAYIFVKSGVVWTDMTETAKLTASDPASYDGFGKSVAVNGDTVVVGAEKDDDAADNSGSVYLFQKPLSGWSTMTQTAKLTASDPGLNDSFGKSVAISDDRVVVGAPYDDDNANDSGSIYIFEKPGAGWSNMTEIFKISAPSKKASDSFGTSVAISSDKVVVGASGNDDGFIHDSGCAYVYQYDAEHFYFMARLTESIVTESQHLGLSVAIYGHSIVVGANNYAYFFEEPSGGWWSGSHEASKLIAPDAVTSIKFGTSVAIYDDRVIVGASLGHDDNDIATGSAYFFENVIVSHTPENIETALDIEATDSDGDTLTYTIYGGSDESHFTINTNSGILTFNTSPDYENPSDANGDNIYELKVQVNDVSEADLALVFIKVGDLEYEGPAVKATSFKMLNQIKADNGGVSDQFGNSIAISGNTAVVGSSARGTVYVFEYNNSSRKFEQVAQLTASDVAIDDDFGISVAISDETVVVGASREDHISLDSGSAYLFEKPFDGWGNMTESAKLVASDGATNDLFGWSVAISGDEVVVGAIGDDDDGYQSGSAYLFEKPSNGWIGTVSENAKFTASDALNGDSFGISAAFSGDILVIGASYDDIMGRAQAGSAYLFEKPLSGWRTMQESVKFTASDSSLNDYFGTSIAIDGNTVVVGSLNNEGAGSVYLFEKALTGWETMTESAKFTASDAAADDEFGISVAISGNTILVGSHEDDCAIDKYACGSAYLFEKPASGWINTTESAKLTASDGESGDNFGFSVAISGDTAIVGAYNDDAAAVDSGSAYVFKVRAQAINPGIIMYLLH